MRRHGYTRLALSGAGGKQCFSLFLQPQGGNEETLEAMSSLERSVEGKLRQKERKEGEARGLGEASRRSAAGRRRSPREQVSTDVQKVRHPLHRCLLLV